MTKNSKNTSGAWRNRIVGYSDEEPDQLLANPSNWRIHPAAQQNALSGVLKEIGLVQNIIANRTTGNVVDGHLRITLAMREGQPTVPVTWVDLTEEEELYILATHDPLAAMATADAGALDALLSSVQSGEEAVTAMLAELAEREGLYMTGEGADTPFSEFDQGPASTAFITFKFGDYGGKVSGDVYRAFVEEYKSQQKQSGALMLDDVLRGWLGV